MDPRRTPQSNLHGATLNISAPRSLRPREELQHAPPRPYPTTPQVPYVVPHNLEARGEDASEYTGHERYAEPNVQVEPSAQSSPGEGSTSMVSGLVSRIRRLPRAFQKHHSRESLYAQYAAEAEAMSIRESSRFPSRGTSQVLYQIPETSVVSESEPMPTVLEDYEGTTAVNHGAPFAALAQPPPTGIHTYLGSQTESTDSSSRVESSADIPLPPKDTWGYYMAIFLLLIAHIRKLPWSSHRIVDDYVPARDGRGGYGEKKPVVSWYKPRNRDKDAEKTTSISPPQLFVLPPTPQSGTYISPAYLPQAQNLVLRSPYSEATTAIRPTRTPMTATSAGLAYMSPGASSHGLGRHSVSYSWYSSSPQQQPWQAMYASEMSTPQPHAVGGYFSPR